MFKYVDGGVHGEVLDFPGVITCAGDLDEARRLLASALVDMAHTSLDAGETFPRPNEEATDPNADLEEPIQLFLRASSRVEFVPQGAV
jgi:hypothetical protein